MGLLQKGSLAPAGGSIKLVGEELLTASDRRLRQLRATTMAMIFQEPMTALNPVVPVGRQIDEVLRAHTGLDARARRQRILAMMEQVRLPEVERIFASFPHRLSGGQRQRIMIAMALVLEPKLLIADEPTTALDVTTQKQILALIRDLQRDHGTAVLFITHDMGVVAEIADRVAVMRQGRLVETGSLDTILRAPVHGLYPQPALGGAEPGAAGAAPGIIRTGRAGGQRTRQGLSRARVVRPHPRSGGRRKCHADTAQGPHARHCRRKRLRQIDGRALHRPPDRSDLRRHSSGGSRNLRAVAPAAATAPQAHPDHFPGSLSLAQSAHHRSAKPSPRVRSTTAYRGRKRWQKPANCSNWSICPPTPSSRYPHQFSGGQRQRIAIARALALDPDVLVADEAVSALDVSVQAQVLELLDEIQTRLGIALLFITHDLRVAAQICDDVAVMQNGRIVEQGPAARVLTNPQVAYTRALLDAAPGREWDFANFRPMVAAAAATS